MLCVLKKSKYLCKITLGIAAVMGLAAMQTIRITNVPYYSLAQQNYVSTYCGNAFVGRSFKIMNDNQPVQEKVMISTKSLSDLAIYLSGVKDGKGNLLPLGTVVLDDLWAAVKYLQGDVRYTAERDVKVR